MLFVPAFDDRKRLPALKFWPAARNRTGLIDRALPGMLVAYRIPS
jgi:hypothetical protein